MRPLTKIDATNTASSESAPAPSSPAAVGWVKPLLAFSHNTSVTVAEVAFLLLLIAGIWIAFGWLVESKRDSPFRGVRFRMIVAGVLIAVAGLLLIIATYWGQLFS